MKILRHLLPLPKISYGITVNNEFEEIAKLLNVLLPLIDKKDEVIVLQDVTNKNEHVSNVLDTYGDKIIRIESCLNGDFATFKNNLIRKATKNYLFQIDADEFPEENLIINLKKYLKKRFKTDVFLIPRVNIVNGLTNDHIEKWDWQINEKGYINFPDYQYRLFKLNKGIVWENKVHEVLRNYKTVNTLPIIDYSMCLIHIKNIERQEKQNSFYDTL